MSDVVGFTEPTAKKLCNEAFSGTTIPFAIPRDFHQPRVCIVRCSLGVTASTTTAPGAGEGIVQIINSDGEYEDYLLDGGGQVRIDIYNTVSSSLPGGETVRYQCKLEDFSNRWLIDVASCG